MLQPESILYRWNILILALLLLSQLFVYSLNCGKLCLVLQCSGQLFIPNSLADYSL